MDGRSMGSPSLPGLQSWGPTPYQLSVLEEPGNPLTVAIVEADVGNGLESWFEVWFDWDSQLAGNARDGYQDASLKLAFRLQRSEDLIVWDHEWLDLGVTRVGNAWRYRARSLFPRDSQTKTGVLMAWNTDGDAQNHPFTAITIASVVQNLANFPYHMPEHAAQLQTDLIAAGWTDATVTADSDVTWAITIYGVAQADTYLKTSQVYWPAYTVDNPLGGTSTVSGCPFLGVWVNAAGVRTAIQHQFARIQILTAQR